MRQRLTCRTLCICRLKKSKNGSEESTLGEKIVLKFESRLYIHSYETTENANDTLRKLSVLDPCLANHNQAAKCIKSLAESRPNVLDEVGALTVEADKYAVDSQVRVIASSFNAHEMRIDVDF